MVRTSSQWYSVFFVSAVAVLGLVLLLGAGMPSPAVAFQATSTPAATTAATTAPTVSATSAATTTTPVTGTSQLSPTIPAPVAVSIDPKTSAYLVLDITDNICTPRPSCVATVPVIAGLLKKARDAGMFVAYSDTGGTAAILPDVAPQANEPKVSGRADKFFNTNLDDLLKGKGIKTVVIVGYVANGAVLYTSYGANARGYTVVVPVDGTGAEDPFAYLLTRYQLLNQPGFANPQNTPLMEGRVTLSRSDLISFSAAVTGTVTAPSGGATPAATGAATTAPTGAATTAATPAATTAATPSAGGGSAPTIPADHVGRTSCQTCHLTGVAGAPKVPAQPDHTAMKDDPTLCMTCHQQAR